MQSVVYVVILSILWVVNLFNGTGLDATYHVTDLAKNICLGLTILLIVAKLYNEGDILIKKKNFYIFSGMVAVFFLSAYFRGYTAQVLEYLWVYCLIFLVGNLEISERVVFWTGMIYGGLGLVVLLIYNFASLFSGWNENSIAMIGMHSYLVFIVYFFNQKNIASNIIIILSAVIFALLIFPTNSRSASLFLILAVLFTLSIIPRKWVINGKYRILVFLLIPLFIAGVIVLITKTNAFETLERWSIRKFQKPIFNGRDVIWEIGFNRLFDNFLFGTGKLISMNWHNSALSCLTAYGAVGYAFWIASFRRIISFSKKYISDPYVIGFIVSFIVLWLQQSVELGLMGADVNLIPYVLLGMMLGRVKHLEIKYENMRGLV